MLRVSREIRREQEELIEQGRRRMRKQSKLLRVRREKKS